MPGERHPGDGPEQAGNRSPRAASSGAQGPCLLLVWEGAGGLETLYTASVYEQTTETQGSCCKCVSRGQGMHLFLHNILLHRVVIPHVSLAKGWLRGALIAPAPSVNFLWITSKTSFPNKSCLLALHTWLKDKAPRYLLPHASFQ